MSLAVASTENYCDMLMARHVAELLDEHYPGHLWAVAIAGGMLQIKNLRLSQTHGFCIRLNEIDHDVAVRNRLVIRGGGELLERAGWKRGRHDGQVAGIMEGARAR